MVVLLNGEKELVKNKPRVSGSPEQKNLATGSGRCATQFVVPSPSTSLNRWVCLGPFPRCCTARDGVRQNQIMRGQVSEFAN